MFNRIGIVGAGRMGSSMAKRLLGCGKNVTVWNRTRTKANALAVLGADIVGATDELVRRCDVLMTSLTEDQAARTLYLGDKGMFGASSVGKFFVETSTLQPATVRELGERAKAAGARFISAPVLGTDAHVLNGQLVVLASGDAADIEAVMPILRLLSRKVVTAGALGAASALKLGVNIVLGVYIEALAESIALATREGISPEMMLDVLAESPMANPFLSFKMPILKGEEAQTAFDLKSLGKDLNSAIATAASSGVSLPAATATLSSIKAGVSAGWGARDIAELPLFYRKELTTRW